MKTRLPLILLLAACGSEGMTTPSDAGAADVTLPPPVGEFPEGFLWGTAIAPYQVEGGLHGDDWFPWETACRVCSGDSADDGPDFWNLYATDMENAASLGTNSIRLGIDWARVFPTESSFPGAPDTEALARYHQIFDAARDEGLSIMLTLHHFATPIWVTELVDRDGNAGWANPEVAELFGEWAGFVATEFGDDVDLWITINEPMAMIGAGWIGGMFPPGKTLATTEALAVSRVMMTAHARAYDAVQANDTTDVDNDENPSLVSIATHNRVFLPVNPDSAADVAAADITRYLNNRMFVDALVYGNIDNNFDGDFDDEGDLKGDPSLAGRMDFIGLNYYGLSLVTAAGDTPPFSGLPFMNDLDRYDVDNAITDFGWSIYPEGFRVVIDELGPYDLPILITENGIADADDDQRPRFLAEHLYEIAAAIAGGADIRGYYHWSLIDNFEWAAGYCPHFGLFHVDFESEALTRTAGAGADVYRQIIQANTVPVELFRTYPSYPFANKYCTRTGL
jgi:beta-glucosidase/6-phospho-beta-glucosidase/beta-galactosidase